MKAHTKPAGTPKNTVVLNSGPGPYNGHLIRLTIAMIVKNEEKTLDRCLSALQPLRDAVASELIITDTGSTDHTVEIAQKYTDHIIHYKWCNDFSAARNTGVEEALGEWFMFLDGDEWFENTNELIAFFKSGECDRYGSATFVVRDYADYSGKTYTDFNALRLSRLYQGFHFEHIVHEDFPRLLPSKMIGDYVHHYGYVFKNEADRLTKHHRNVELLEKALEQDPKDIKMYYQLSREYFMTNELDLVKKYAKLGLSVEQQNPSLKRKLMLYHNLIKASYVQAKYEEVIQYVDEISSDISDKNIFWMDFDFLAQSAAMVLEEYERSVSYGNDYLRLWDRRKADDLDPDMNFALDFNCIQPSHREQVILWMLNADMKLGRFLPVKETLEAMPFSETGSFQNLPGLVCGYCVCTDDWEQLSAFYRAALSVQGQLYWKKLIGLLEDYLSDKPEKRLEADRAIATLEDNEDAYVHLCRLRVAVADEDREAEKREMDWFPQWDGEWDPVLSDAVFFGMRQEVDLIPIFCKIETEDVKFFIDKMRKRHDNFETIALDYLNAASHEDIAGLFWAISIRENIILRESPEAPEDDTVPLFEAYADEFNRYVHKLINPELLSPENVSVLPRAHRFGYYLGCAFSARNRGDEVSYLANLRLALHSYPVMERQVAILLERFERKSREEQAKADEFHSLASQVKNNIRTLIRQGNLEEAGRFTLQLARLMPNDPDVTLFRSLTNTEPDMKELAASLPQ